MSVDWRDGSIDKDLYDFIRKVLPEGSTILELGSGWGTGKLAEHYKMYSVEHDPEFVGKYDSTYIYAPLKWHKTARNHGGSNWWYDIDILRPAIKEIEYDLLLIDGPPGQRGGFVKYMRMFDRSVIWIFDDAQRSKDWKVVNSAAALVGVPWVTYRSGTKAYAVLNNPLLREEV